MIYNDRHSKKGFTLIEILVGIAILAILSSISISAFYNQSKNASAEKDSQNTLSYIQKARDMTLSGTDNSSFGVYFSTSTISLFEGSSYSPSNIQETFSRTPSVSMTTNLSGGVDQVYFARLTGLPSATGTITFIPSGTNSSSKIIDISATGLAEIQ